LGELVDGHARDGEHADALDDAAERPDNASSRIASICAVNAARFLRLESSHLVVGAVVGLHEGDVPEVSSATAVMDPERLRRSREAS
jgi:hypothetical protein